MNDVSKPQPFAVAYRVIDLKNAFTAVRDSHAEKAGKHPMGEQGFHETLAKVASANLKILEDGTWGDYDVIIFPSVLAEFSTAITPLVGGLKTFQDYYNVGRLTHVPTKETIKLFPR